MLVMCRQLVFLLFLRSSSLIEQTQICLPPNGKNAAKYASVLYGYIGETKRRDRWPHLAAVDPAGRYCMLYSLDDLGKCCAAKERLHAEEIGVKNWREKGLIYCHLSYCQFLLRRHWAGGSGPLLSRIESWNCS